MARFGFQISKGASSVKTIASLTAAASTPRRAKLQEISFGSSATPGDNAFLFQIQRATTSATQTNVTPNALDPADPVAATVVAGGTVTADGTLTANAFLWGVAMNQRASFRWAAVPYCELIIPATASNGICLILSAASTTVFDSGGVFEEM